MTHRRWNAVVKRGLALMEKRPQEAMRLFDRLAQAVDRHNRSSVQDWHGSQTRYLLSFAQRRAGEAAAARKTLVRIAEEHRQALSFHMRAFGSASAAAALEFAEAGKSASAERMLNGVSRIGRTLEPKDRLLRQARTAVRTALRRTRPKRP
jgi:hypothetical protein